MPMSRDEGFAKLQKMTRRLGTARLALALLAVGVLSGAAAITDKEGRAPFCSDVLLSLRDAFEP